MKKSNQIVLIFFLIALLILQAGCTGTKNKASSQKKEVEKKLAVHDITKDEVYDKYIEASDFISRNYVYQNDVDHDDGFKDSDGREFYRYTGDEFKSIEDVKAKLREYFTSDVVKKYETGDYKDRYIEKDGKLYSKYPGGIGFMGQINIDVERDGNDKFSIYHVYYPTGTHPDDVEWQPGFPELEYVSEGKSKKSLVHCVRTKDGWKFDNVADQGVTGRIIEEFAQYDEKDKKPYKDILSKFEGYVDDPESVPETDWNKKNIKNFLTDGQFGMLSYSLKDINDDGTKELIFQQSSYDSEAEGCFIIAMYTLVSGKPELVCTSSVENDARYTLEEDDILYRFSGAALQESLLKLKPNSKNFDILKNANRLKDEYFDAEDIPEPQRINCRPVGL